MKKLRVIDWIMSTMLVVLVIGVTQIIEENGRMVDRYIIAVSPSDEKEINIEIPEEKKESKYKLYDGGWVKLRKEQIQAFHIWDKGEKDERINIETYDRDRYLLKLTKKAMAELY